MLGRLPAGMLACGAAALSITLAQAANAPSPRAGATAGSAIAAWAGEQSYPRVAWHAENNGTYLVVYEDHLDLDEGYNVTGVRLDSRGAQYPGEITIADDSRHRTRPDVAPGMVGGYSGFLVVYHLLYSSTDQDVYARFVTANGTLPGAEIPIATTGYWEYDPAVAWSVDGGWLIVWCRLVNGGPDSAVWCETYSGGVFGVPVQLTPDAGSEGQPTATFDASTGGWLVAWTENQDIRGRRVLPDGTPSGAAFDIVAQPGIQVGPRLRAAGSSPVIAMVYQSDLAEATGTFRVRGAIITPAGVTLGPVIADQGNYPGSGPDLSWSDPLNGWIAIWEQYYAESDHDIYATLLRTDMAPREAPLCVTNSTAMEIRPAVCCVTGLSLLTVWQDYRNASINPDIYGQLLPLGQLEGHVYRGAVGNTRVPFEGVTVQLWEGASGLETYLGDAVTWATGWFHLGYFNPPNHLHIWTVPPSGYSGAGATSPDGTVVTANWIKYDFPAAQDYTGNVFWLVNPLTGVSDPSLPSSLAASEPWPNPATAAVSLRLSGGTAEQDRVEVFDLRGRRISEAIAPRSGEGIVRWDGCLRDGRRAPAGVYWLRVSNGSESVGRRVVLGGR